MNSYMLKLNCSIKALSAIMLLLVAPYHALANPLSNPKEVRANINKDFVTDIPTKPLKNEEPELNEKNENALNNALGLTDDENNKAPTYIRSDHLLLKQEERVFEYTDNVEVIRGDLTMLSDILVGEYDENSEITALVAKSNVHITKGEHIQANGEKAIYQRATETLTLTENPEMVRDGNILSADRIVIYLNDDRSTAEGHVRVKLVGDPDKKEDQSEGELDANDDSLLNETE